MPQFMVIVAIADKDGFVNVNENKVKQSFMLELDCSHVTAESSKTFAKGLQLVF